VPRLWDALREHYVNTLTLVAAATSYFFMEIFLTWGFFIVQHVEPAGIAEDLVSPAKVLGVARLIFAGGFLVSVTVSTWFDTRDLLQRRKDRGQR